MESYWLKDLSLTHQSLQGWNLWNPGFSPIVRGSVKLWLNSVAGFLSYNSLLKLYTSEIVAFVHFNFIGIKSPSVNRLSKAVNIFWTLMLHIFQSTAIIFITSTLSMETERREQKNFPIALILGVRSVGHRTQIFKTERKERSYKSECGSGSIFWTVNPTTPTYTRPIFHCALTLQPAATPRPMLARALCAVQCDRTLGQLSWSPVPEAVWPWVSPYGSVSFSFHTVKWAYQCLPGGVVVRIREGHAHESLAQSCCSENSRLASNGVCPRQCAAEGLEFT